MSITLLLAGLLGAASQAVAAELPAVEGITHDGEKVTPHEFNGDLRHLPLALPAQAPAEQPYRPLLRPPVSPKIPPAAAVTEKTAATISGPLAPMPSPALSFAGMSRSDACTGGTCGGGIPPDPNGDVGPNHYIQAVNTAYAIYSKTGTLLASFTENQLWAGAGTLCNSHSRGDPVVLYDRLADRWILTHLAFATNSGPFFQCIAASKTSNPVSGGWWLYALRMDSGGAGPPAGALNDYPRFGIWHDCLYMSANEFNIAVDPETYLGVAFASFSRSDLYTGAALTWSLGFINNASDPFTMVPSNLSGQAAASVLAGTPNYFVSESQTAFAFEVRKFTPGPNCGGGGSLSAATNVSQMPYSLATFSSGVPQPGTTNKLDNIDDRIMQKVQYRKIGGAESLWVTHNVGTGSGPTAMTAMQWAQIDVTGGTIATTPVQQQIYAPDTALWRWMGSLAVDNQGNMALGYSTSNGTNFPSIAYSGRLATDPLNTLPQTEIQLVAGSGSQTNTCGGAPCRRWGDYTAMSVDPADDCTFWYTNQYYSSPANGASGNWQTRIGSFKFPSCVPSTPPSALTIINHYYQNILGRAGDAGGVAYWESEVARLSGLGVDPTEAFIAMAVAFYTSAEFAARGLGDTAFVDSLYGTFFNRAADAGGRSFWVGQINLGLSREMVMYGFLFSSEFASFMAQNLGSTPSRAELYAVIDFYRGAFGRLPDTAGFKFWVNQFRSAQCSSNPTGPVYDAVVAIASGFFESAEYWPSSPAKTNYNHISNFYNAFMRRGADVTGYLFWVNQLDGGANFNTVRRTGFIDSPEFALRVQQIVNAGCTTLML